MLTNQKELADLSLLNQLRHAAGADFRCGNRQGCLKGTRKEVLLKIDHWLRDKQGHRIFWLNGVAGTGKSTIAQTFAETTFADGMLGASFFCLRDVADQSNLNAIFPTLAFQLAYQYPRFQERLLQVLRRNPDVGQESLYLQMKKLIVGPLKASHTQTIIIIDALDECKDTESDSAILSTLSHYINDIPDVRFFITGRPESQIRSGFRLGSLPHTTETFDLHQVKPEVVYNDIELFFQTQLTKLAKNRSDCNVVEGWPSSSDIGTLCRKAAGFFIYASTVVKFIGSKNHKPTKRLDRIITFPQSTSDEGKSGVDILYTQVMKQAVCDISADDEEYNLQFRTVLGAVSLVYNPLSVKALSDLLKVPDVSTALRSLHSLLLVPESRDDPVCVFHKSFPDFLTNKLRCNEDRFFIDSSTHHTDILHFCLDLMRERLKRNICKLQDYILLSEVEDLSERRKEHIGDALEYACCFWTKHLLKITHSTIAVVKVQEVVDKFFKTHLLLWIEVLSLMRSLKTSIYALNDLQQWYLKVSCV